MHTIARGQTSSVSNPILDTYIVAAGVLTDVISIEYAIDEFVTSTSSPTVVTARTAMDIDDDKVSTGRYALPMAVGGTARVGLYRATIWYQVDADSDEQSFKQVFEVIASSAMGISGTPLASVQSMRDEGVPVSAYSDAVVLRKLIEASQEFEDYTGRFFGPRYLEILADGTGAEALMLEEPIIGIAEVAIVTSDSVQSGPVDADTIKVYNRHITQNLKDPDDRENPKIEFYSSEYYDYYGSRQRGPALVYRRWPTGRQNISVKGVFGYTEPNGTPTGGIPMRVAQAVRMLALANMPVLTDADARQDAGNRWQVVSERTRDQSIARFSGVDAGNRSTIIGSITGDPAVDRIIVQYRRHGRFGSA